MMKVISLGWGVQSWTLAAMSALGKFEPVDVALHSDTTWERQATYEFARQWTPWLEERGVRVVTVTADDCSPIRTWSKSVGLMIPAFTTYDNGKPSGVARRQCTHDWKIVAMRRWLRSQGVKQAEQWLGITRDEIERAKDSDVQWITHRFPLLEKQMTRQDCIVWLQSHSLPVPPKSSCVFCPYHRRQTWVEMKEVNGPDWQTAVEVDEAIRNKRPGYIAYVHPDRIPLIELKTAADFGATQLSFVDTSNAECDSGFCFL